MSFSPQPDALLCCVKLKNLGVKSWCLADRRGQTFSFELSFSDLSAASMLNEMLRNGTVVKNVFDCMGVEPITF